jgi:hypothetical protein
MFLLTDRVYLHRQRVIPVTDRPPDRPLPPPPPPAVEDASDDDDDDDKEAPSAPIHDVAKIPDFPKRSLRSGHVLAGAGGSSDDRVERGGATTFSAGLPGGIRLT